jgi:hypothetical protein
MGTVQRWTGRWVRYRGGQVDGYGTEGGRYMGTVQRWTGRWVRCSGGQVDGYGTEVDR